MTEKTSFVIERRRDGNERWSNKLSLWPSDTLLFGPDKQDGSGQRLETGAERLDSGLDSAPGPVKRVGARLFRMMAVVHSLDMHDALIKLSVHRSVA